MHGQFNGQLANIQPESYVIEMETKLEDYL